MSGGMPEFDGPQKGALYMKEAYGVAIIAVKPNSKRPLNSGWTTESLDVPTIESVYTTDNTGELYNFGVNAGASRLLIVDIDNKDGRDGNASWGAFQKMHDFIAPPTLTIQSPTGGFHYYFSDPKGEGRNSTGELGDGIDTKGGGGQVVAPGSRTADGEYKIVRPGPIAEAPQRLLRRLNAKAAPPLDRPAIAKVDALTEIEKAVEYLKGAEPCIEFQGGNNRLYLTFCEVRDLGMAMDTAVGLMTEHFNPRCVPEWSDDDLATVARNAYNFAQNSLGAKTEEAATASAVADFKSVPVPEAAKHKERARVPLALVSASTVLQRATPRRDWIIKNVALGSFLSITGAPGGTGKSNYEILKAIAVVTGRSLLGDKKTVFKRGAVVLYNCEDPLEEMERRVKAFCALFGINASEVAELYLVSGRDQSLCVANTNSKGEVAINDSAVETLVATVKSVGAVYLSVDPLVRTHWLNENDNMAMDKVTQAFQRVSSETGCGVTIVHHTNKAALGTKKGDDSASQAVFRGAGSLVASARIGEVLTTMNESEARKFGVPVEKRRYYFKVENAKANLSAPAEFADWYENLGQEIDNGEIIGVCRLVVLVALSKVEKVARDTIAREDGLRYLRDSVPESGTGFDVIKAGLAKACGIKCRRTSAVREKVLTLLGDQKEFRFPQPDPRKPYLVERARVDILAQSRGPKAL